jgi:hypothetical protein
MGKLFGLILMVVGIYIGLTYYTAGMEEASTSEEPAALAQRPAKVTGKDAGRTSRLPPVTHRVRDRVQGAVDAGARRHGGGQ